MRSTHQEMLSRAGRLRVMAGVGWHFITGGCLGYHYGTSEGAQAAAKLLTFSSGEQSALANRKLESLSPPWPTLPVCTSQDSSQDPSLWPPRSAFPPLLPHPEVNSWGSCYSLCSWCNISCTGLVLFLFVSQTEETAIKIISGKRGSNSIWIEFRTWEQQRIL